MAGNSFGSLVMLALITEFLTEMLRSSIPYLDRVSGKWIAAVIGILLCYITDTGVLDLVGSYSRNPYFDYFITGLIISRGSGVLHELLEALKGFTHRFRHGA